MLLLLPVLGIAKVRTAYVNGDQVIVVRTAMGIATIIQTPEKPSSAVIGDMESFKMEYLDSAITIKPLSHNAKTNLYIYTEGRRYNVQLLTVSADMADYIVYLKPELPKQDKYPNNSIQWKKYNYSTCDKRSCLKILRLGKNHNQLFFEFQVLSLVGTLKLKPDQFWLTQNGKTRPIHQLHLSALESSKSKPVNGLATLLMTDFDLDYAIHFEMLQTKLLDIKLPGMNRWIK